MGNRERIIALADEAINYRNMVSFKPVLMEIKHLAEDEEEYYATKLLNGRDLPNDEEMTAIPQPVETMHPDQIEAAKERTYTDEEWFEEPPKKKRKQSFGGGRKRSCGAQDKELMDDGPAIEVKADLSRRKVRIDSKTEVYCKDGETDEECRARFLAKYKNSFKY